MKILVDADACPVKEIIIDISIELDIQTIMVASLSHRIEAGEGVRVIRVDNSSQEADMAIINRAESGDVVVTDDYGLAALVLGKGGYPISFRGRPFTDKNIEPLLEARHRRAKERRAGSKTSGPRPFSQADRRAFSSGLRSLLMKHIK